MDQPSDSSYSMSDRGNQKFMPVIDEAKFMKTLGTAPAPETRLPAYLGDRRLLVSLNTGQPLVVDTDSLDIGLGLIREGLWEPWIGRHLAQYALRRGDPVIVDIGAHIGYYGVLLGALAPSRRVWAFEPNARLFDILRTNFFINGLDRQRVQQIAIGGEEGTLKLRHRPGEAGGGHISPSEPDEGFVAQTVSVRRLDDVLPSWEEVDLLKMDVEGLEPSVLRGAEQVIDRSPNVLVCMELAADSWRSRGHDPRDVLDWLVQKGFHLALAVVDEPLIRKSPDDLLQQAQSLHYVTCVLACRDISFMQDDRGGRRR